eukprot:TRINITY_DN34822_c0_g1_i1.p1 TRINITY_DN34822_c0_g1~~TRINITY_DN34822_c0_g1_i1.p1  ORF type:complete len:646 (-),score=117.89 TRINITY_DN34822_c0_g1_i1:2767-4704(-)
MASVVLSLLYLFYHRLTASASPSLPQDKSYNPSVRKHKLPLSKLLDRLAEAAVEGDESVEEPAAVSSLNAQRKPISSMRESFGTMTIDLDSPEVINVDPSALGSKLDTPRSVAIDEKAGDSSPERNSSSPSSRKGTTIGSSKRRAKKNAKKHVDSIFDKPVDEEMSGLVAAPVGRRRSSASIRGLDVALNVLEDILSEQGNSTTGKRLRQVSEIISQSKAELVDGKTVTKREVKSGEDKEVASWLRSGFLNVQRESLSKDGDQKDDEKSILARNRWNTVIQGVHEQTLSQDSSSEFQTDFASKEDVDEMVSIVGNVTPLLSKINSWDEFDIFALSDQTDGQPLVTLAWYLFEQNGLFDKFGISKTIFLNVFTSIEGGYNDVPYHNNVHAADVLANTYYFILSKPLSALLTKLDLLASMVAASVHDFKHPGTNNPFSVATGDEFALIYNDRSVLENMHVSEAFRLFRQEHHDLFSSLGPSERKEVRQTIISMVLATDMSQHLKYSSDLEASIKAKKEAASWFKTDAYEDRLVCLNMALHVADLGNPAKPLKLCLMWTVRVLEEFFRQGDKERALGIPVSAMMNREKPNIEKSQIGFIDYVINPLFKLWSVLIPEETQCCVDNIKFNRQHWESQLSAAIISNSLSPM